MSLIENFYLNLMQNVSLSKRRQLLKSFVEKVESNFLTFAERFGYPENPGMRRPKSIYELTSDEVDETVKLAKRLVKRETNFPPSAVDFPPQSFTAVFFGELPRIKPLFRNFYESQEDGFYNFYLENFSNMRFLPNWLSALIQLRFNMCIDLTFLEVFREVIFLAIVLYWNVVNCRAILSWFIIINPYQGPLRYFISSVDWVEEQVGTFVPALGGTSLFLTLYMVLIGYVGDSLNHLVFTMPFLPSEYEYGRTSIDGQYRDIIIYRHLPKLWYDHPIPNDLREFWYYRRPEILDYMITTYKDTNIQFLPDQIINTF